MADLQDRLEVIRTEMAARTSEAKQTAREKQDHKSLRHFSVGEKVLFRIPGLSNKLGSSWEGPFQVEKVIGDLNYVISMVVDGKSHKRTDYVNHLKPYIEGLMVINRVVVITDECDNCCLPDGDPLSYLSDSQSKELQSVLSKFKDTFSSVPGITNICLFRIDTTQETPISLPPYRVPNGLVNQFKVELDVLLAQGVIEHSDAMWAFPAIPVRKKDGGLRLVVDYRRLNSITPSLPFYMPTVEEVIAKLGGAQYFSKIDLTKGFHQIPIEKESITFITPFGKFRYLRLPFGLKNAPAHFQSMMSQCLSSVSHCSTPYIDDVIIFSKSWSQFI